MEPNLNHILGDLWRKCNSDRGIKTLNLHLGVPRSRDSHGIQSELDEQDVADLFPAKASAKPICVLKFSNITLEAVALQPRGLFFEGPSHSEIH